MKIKLLMNDEITFWAKEGNNTYSRNIKDLLDYLEIKYELEDLE